MKCGFRIPSLRDLNLLRPLIGWMRPTHIIDSSLLYLKPAGKFAILCALAVTTTPYTSGSGLCRHSAGIIWTHWKNKMKTQIRWLCGRYPNRETSVACFLLVVGGHSRMFPGLWELLVCPEVHWPLGLMGSTWGHISVLLGAGFAWDNWSWGLSPVAAYSWVCTE